MEVSPKGRAVFDTAVLEAVLSRELSHPQVVRTFEWCTRLEEVGTLGMLGAGNTAQQRWGSSTREGGH